MTLSPVRWLILGSVSSYPLSYEAGYSAVCKKCLKMMKEPANYLMALTRCISMGTRLASIQSQAEQMLSLD